MSEKIVLTGDILEILSVFQQLGSTWKPVEATPTGKLNSRDNLIWNLCLMKEK